LIQKNKRKIEKTLEIGSFKRGVGNDYLRGLRGEPSFKLGLASHVNCIESNSLNSYESNKTLKFDSIRFDQSPINALIDETLAV
jgi:hypothetical protein